MFCFIFLIIFYIYISENLPTLILLGTYSFALVLSHNYSCEDWSTWWMFFLKPDFKTHLREYNI